MGWLTIRKWEDWQSYRKDRPKPNWIKLHRCVLRDPDWIALSDAERAHLVSIWMIAADRDGKIPDDPKLIQKMCCLDKPPDLNMLIERGFLVGDQAVTNPPQTVGLEESREEESREEKNNIGAKNAPDEILSYLKTVLREEVCKEVVDYRKRIKQPLTPLAAKKLAKQLAKWPDPEDGAAEMMLRGWRGFKPEWMVEAGRDKVVPFKSSGPKRTWAEQMAEKNG